MRATSRAQQRELEAPPGPRGTRSPVRQHYDGKQREPEQGVNFEARSSVVLFAATRSRKPLAAVAPSDCDRRCPRPRGWAATVIPGPVRMGHRDPP
jgi:hypothetical protein